MMPGAELSRRVLLAGAASILLAGCSREARGDWDLIVAGAGAAGLSAAVAAAEQGLRVLVLEKMPGVGGSTRISGGFFGAVDPVRQSRQGIEDSEALFLRQMLESGGGHADPALAAVLVREAGPMLAWLESHGMQFAPSVSEVYGSLWPRCHKPMMSNGEGYVRTLMLLAADLGVKILTGAAVQDLVTDGGRVSGVKALWEGREALFRARRGVVIACGGFAASPEMIRRFAPKYAGLKTNSAPGATGEVLLMAQRAGAELLDMDRVLCNPGAPPDRSNRARFHMLVNQFIFVNRDGRRFIREDAPRSALSEAVLAQPGRHAFTVIDFRGFRALSPLMQKEAVLAIESGDAWADGSLSQLARKMGVPPGHLQTTVEAYNRGVSARRDPLGKSLHGLALPLSEPPFWACYAGMSVHYTLGGIRISPRAEALDAARSPIPGLWAAGEAAGGVHGVNRLGGSGINDALIFGRIAGRAAAGLDSHGLGPA